VREVVRDQKLTDDEIIDVLQCCDYSVDLAVAALRKGQVPADCFASKICHFNFFCDFVIVIVITVCLKMSPILLFF